VSLATPTLHLIDASYFIFRAYYALPEPMQDPQGRPVNALYGFTRFLLEYVERHQPTHIAVAFDGATEGNFRTDLYPDYKANREPAPDDLSEQFERCFEVCAPLGLHALCAEGFEADDIIGTLATHGRGQGYRNWIVSRDKDLSQLIREGDHFYDYSDGRRYGYNDIAAKFGVIPERMADYLALTGDAVDNIPGVPGVGPKTASAILTHFDSLDDLYARLPEVSQLTIRGAKTLADKLGEHKDKAYHARQLTQIACEVPLDCEVSQLKRRAVDHHALDAFYTTAGFGVSLRTRAQRLTVSD